MDIVALVGSETPLGREVREVLTDAGLGNALRLIGASDESGSILTEHAGEATVLSPLDESELRDADVIVNAVGGDAGPRTHKLVPQTPLVDLTGVLESEGGARIRCPLVDEEERTPGNPLIVAHPAAAALAILLRRLQRSFPARHAVAHIFEPASERGPAGLHELQQQVSALLSFRPLEKRVFDAQAAFNLLPRYGDEAPEALDVIESRIGRHLATLLAGSAPMPSLRLIHAPVFHGHAGSLWVEFEDRPPANAVAEAIASVQIEVRGADVEPPSNAGVAGLSGVVAGPIEADINHPRAMWMWFAVDNYRISADSALRLVRAVLTGRDS
jgi:aspartate-semialdehyde dehydrogenase